MDASAGSQLEAQRQVEQSGASKEEECGGGRRLALFVKSRGSQNGAVRVDKVNTD